MPKTAATGVVTLYPTGTARIQYEPRLSPIHELVTEASPEAAAILLSYQPPAFSTTPTPFSDALEALDPPHPHNVIDVLPDALPTESAPEVVAEPAPAPAPLVEPSTGSPTEPEGAN